jgi:hypothetical protein
VVLPVLLLLVLLVLLLLAQASLQLPLLPFRVQLQ